MIVLYGVDPGITGNIIRRALVKNDGREVGSAKFKGADKFVGYLQRGVFFSPDNPSQVELERAIQFGQDTVGYIKSNGYLRQPKDPFPPAAFFWLLSNKL